jgi:hypothetical protein
LFTHPESDHHEEVLVCHEERTGLRGIIAVHSSALGPAAGDPSARFESSGKVDRDSTATPALTTYLPKTATRESVIVSGLTFA